MVKYSIPKVLFVLALLLPLSAETVRADAFSDFDAAREAYNGGNYDLAIHYHTRAIQSGELSDDNLAIVFGNRGNAYSDKGDYDRAIRDYV